MLGWQCREFLPRALTHVLTHRPGGARAFEGCAPGALEPGRSVVIMPHGKIYTLECTRYPGLRFGLAALGSLATLPPIPEWLSSRGMGSLLGPGIPWGLECAFRADANTDKSTPRDAEDLACGDEPAADYGPHQLASHDFEVPLRGLDRRGSVPVVQSIMGEVWGIEDALCRAAISRLCEYRAPPGLASMAARDDVTGFLTLLKNEARLAGLDTAIVDSARLRGMCGACPGLTAVEPYSGILRHGPFTILAHDRFPGQMAVISSTYGPTLVHGPTVIHCEDSALAVRIYCQVVESTTNNSLGLVGGIRVVL